MSKKIDNLASESLNLIKSFENDLLFKLEEGTTYSDWKKGFALSVHFDGKENYAIGYGLDLYVNNWTTIKGWIDKVNDVVTNDFNYNAKKTFKVLKNENGSGTEEEDSSLSFEDLVTDYKIEVKQLSKEEKKVLIWLQKTLKSLRVSNKSFSFPNEFEINEKLYNNLDQNTATYNKIRKIYYNIIRHLITFKLPDTDYADKLFKEIAESKYDSAKTAIDRSYGDYFSKLSKYQKGAVFSMTYNAGANGLFKDGYTSPKKIREYVKNKDSEVDSDKEKAIKARTRAWYELRYNSCKEAWNRESTRRGLARRRYNEGDLFGLYEDNITSKEAKWILEAFEDKAVKKTDKKNNNKEIKSIYEIAKYFEANIVAIPNEKNVLDEKIKGIEDIKKDLENKSKETDSKPVEEIKAEAKEKGRFLDNVSEEFLKEYNQKYGLVLDKEKPIYNSITKIQEHNDVLIFPLMDRLVVSMEKEKEKARDEDKKNAIHQLINRCKETLEEVINKLGGYKQIAYKKDNNKDLTNLDRKRRLIANFKPKQFNCPDTKKSHEFFESFMTEEDKKKEEAKKESEEKKQREEERKQREAEEEKKRKMYAQESEKKKEVEREKAKKREGWIIVHENSEVKYMNRKEYYGV
ncbi:hypothetical protein [Orenia marismortui]|uniref:hypothetical protein n=1 Tax=Orenia marismortui TaxID=46469 RepID=UPI00036B61A0|nr:hypothetical protein [Orenia marismortui]